MKNKWMWLLNALLVVLLLNLVACAVAVYEAPIITGTVPPPALGVTVCSENNLPVIVISENVPSSPIREVVIFHERVHVEQVRMYRGCKEFMNAYRNSKHFRVSKEMEAYCKAIPFALDLGASGDKMWNEIQQVMRFHFDTTGVTCGGDNGSIVEPDGTRVVSPQRVSRRSSFSAVRDSS